MTQYLKLKVMRQLNVKLYYKVGFMNRYNYTTQSQCNCYFVLNEFIINLIY